MDVPYLSHFGTLKFFFRHILLNSGGNFPKKKTNYVCFSFILALVRICEWIFWSNSLR